MAAKNTADLLAENLAVVTSQTAPESITPATLGGVELKNIIESLWNKVDWNPDDLIIPICLSGQITTPISPIQVFQVLLNNLCTLMSGSTNSANQGRPGLFLAYIGVNQQLVEGVTGAAGTSHGKILFTNDYELGGFDNGNNWSTFNYKVPQGGFNKKVVMTSLEIETVVVPAATFTFDFQLMKNGLAAGMPKVSFSFPSTAAVGDKFYTPPMAMDFTSAPLIEGDLISVEIIRPSPNFTDPIVGTFKINAGSISNED